MFEPVENLVDRRQRLQLDIRLDLARGSEGERFGHVLARSNERTAYSYAVRYHIEERNREFAWWQPDQHASPELPGHGHALLKCAEGGRRNQNAMGSATGLLLQGGCRVISLGVDHEIGANSLGMGQFPIIDVDRTNEQSHGLGILDRQMPESACSRDGDPFAGLGRGLLDPLVGSDASADQWGGIHRS